METNKLAELVRDSAVTQLNYIDFKFAMDQSPTRLNAEMAWDVIIGALSKAGLVNSELFESLLFNVGIEEGKNGNK